jgi:hypothetical protein
MARRHVAIVGAGLVAVLAAVAAVIAFAGGGDGTASASAKECPTEWKAGWQKLADDAGAVVYCPTWMPAPLDGNIDGTYANGRWVSDDRSYLVSLLWFERGQGEISGEVHVNFRGYPGSTAIPGCEDTLTVDGVTKKRTIPCFSDPRGTRTIGDITARVFTVNQGIDQWHILYAWERDGSLYTVSQHVIDPTPFQRVAANLDRLVAGLVEVEPQTDA